MIEDGRDEFNVPDAGTESENAIMVSFRQGLADQMWADRQNHRH